MNNILYIDYFYFFKSYPDIIEDNEFITSKLDYICYVEDFYKNKIENKPIFKIDIEKFLDIIYKEKNETIDSIFNKNVIVHLNEKYMITITHTENYQTFEILNNTEKNENFNLYCFEISKYDNNNFYYFNNDELKNIKRNIIINKCLIN